MSDETDTLTTGAETDSDVELELPIDVFDSLQDCDESERRVTIEEVRAVRDMDTNELNSLSDIETENVAIESLDDTDDSLHQYANPDMDAVETPPEHHEIKSCDFCGRNHDLPTGQGVYERGTSVMTNNQEEEYLCEFCFAQVVAQRSGHNVLKSYMLVDAAENTANDAWQIARHFGCGRVEEIRVLVTEMIQEWLYADARVQNDNPQSLTDTEQVVQELVEFTTLPEYMGEFHDAQSSVLSSAESE
jgi:hypothetical protein